MEPATFTIAIPTHNRRATVQLAVLSVLRQTRAPVQVLALCDGCTDGTAEAVRALGDLVEAIELPKGPGYAYGHRNLALEHARGSVIVWLGDDDLLLPEHLERIGREYDDAVADVVTTPAAIVHPDDSLEWLGEDWGVAWHRAKLDQRNTNAMATVSVPVERALAAGGWDATLPRLGDWDLWKRVLVPGVTVTMTAEPTVLHFRATGREQDWQARVRQNEAWLERISDPARLPEVRRRLRDLQSARVAALLAENRRLALELEALRRDASLRARLGKLKRRLSPRG